MKTAFKLLILPLILLARSTQAQSDLVINGGFESGIAGWSGGLIVMPASFAFEGGYVGVIVDQTSCRNGQTLDQTIPTVPGQAYDYTFSLLSGYGRVGEGLYSPGNAPVNIYFGDQYLGVCSNPSTTTWQTYQFEVTADSAATTLDFLDYTDQHWQILDGVSVVAAPEPASTGVWGLIAAAAMGLSGIHAIGRKQVAAQIVVPTQE